MATSIGSIGRSTPLGKPQKNQSEKSKITFKQKNVTQALRADRLAAVMNCVTSLKNNEKAKLIK